jgi:hypothetical protein
VPLVPWRDVVGVAAGSGCRPARLATVPTPGLLVELAGSLHPELALRRNQPVMIGAPRQSVAGRAG